MKIAPVSSMREAIRPLRREVKKVSEDEDGERQEVEPQLETEKQKRGVTTTNILPKPHE